MEICELLAEQQHFRTLMGIVAGLWFVIKNQEYVNWQTHNHTTL